MAEHTKALEQLGAKADAIAERVAAAWQQRSVEVLGDPLPHGLDLDHLPLLIQELAAAAPKGPGDPAARRLMRTAIKHGKHRRAQDYADTLIFREYHLLRRFLWEELKLMDADQQAIVGAILLMDAAMTASTAASIRGYHLLEHPVDEEKLVERLVSDWVMPLG